MTAANSSINAAIVGTIDTAAGPRQIQTTWQYDVQDPFAVRVIFVTRAVAPESREEGDVVPWVFARALLLDGLSGPSGDGDVHFEPTGAGAIRLTLVSPSGHARFIFPAGELRAFAARTVRACAVGEELAHFDVDRELSYLLDP